MWEREEGRKEGLRKALEKGAIERMKHL